MYKGRPMKLEYIIEGKEYQKHLTSIIPKQKKEIKISKKNTKIQGNNNYLLTIEAMSSPIACAEILSFIAEKIKEVFTKEAVKYYILTDEASIAFCYRLYPLVCEFETKLRKFVYVALFDLDESAKDLTISKIKKSAGKEFSNIAEIPTTNFLEKITLGNLFDFLFDNNEFTTEAKTKTNNIVNDIGRTVTKQELIAIIEKIDEKTIWNKLFQSNFGDFTLPNFHRDIFTYRNDVMHFHTITYKNYKKAFSLLKKLNKELDVQIDKGIVLENTTDNVEAVSNNSQYWLTALDSIIKATQKLANLNIDHIIPKLKYWENLANLVIPDYSKRLPDILPRMPEIMNPLINHPPYLSTPLYAVSKDDNHNNDNDDNDDDEEENQDINKKDADLTEMSTPNSVENGVTENYKNTDKKS